MSVSPTQPPVDPSAVRPGRWLYLLAGVIAVAAIGLAVVAIAVSAARQPSLRALGAGVQTMTLRAEEPKWLYVSEPNRIPPPCQLLGAGDVTIEPLARLTSVEHDGDTWYALARISVSADGQYGLACTDAPGGIQVALGSEPRDAGLLGSVAAKFLVPIFGVIAAFVVFLVTLLRRRSHRAQLVSAASGSTWAPPLPGGPPGYGPPPGQPYQQGYPQYPPDQYPGQGGQPPTQFWQG